MNHLFPLKKDIQLFINALTNLTHWGNLLLNIAVLYTGRSTFLCDRSKISLPFHTILTCILNTYPIPTDKYSCHLSSKKLFFEVDRDHYRNHSWSKYKEQLIEVYPGPVVTSTIQLLHRRLREHYRRWGRKMVKVSGPKSL